jgi:hypothetical protein
MEDCLSRHYCQALDTIFPRKISQLEKLRYVDDDLPQAVLASFIGEQLAPV